MRRRARHLQRAVRAPSRCGRGEVRHLPFSSSVSGACWRTSLNRVRLAGKLLASPPELAAAATQRRSPHPPMNTTLQRVRLALSLLPPPPPPPSLAKLPRYLRSKIPPGQLLRRARQPSVEERLASARLPTTFSWISTAAYPSKWGMVKKPFACAARTASFSPRSSTRTARIGPSGGVTSPKRLMSALLNGRSHANALPPTVHVRPPQCSPRRPPAGPSPSERPRRPSPPGRPYGDPNGGGDPMVGVMRRSRARRTNPSRRDQCSRSANWLHTSQFSDLSGVMVSPDRVCRRYRRLGELAADVERGDLSDGDRQRQDDDEHPGQRDVAVEVVEAVLGQRHGLGGVGPVAVEQLGAALERLVELGQVAVERVELGDEVVARIRRGRGSSSSSCGGPRRSGGCRLARRRPTRPGRRRRRSRGRSAARRAPRARSRRCRPRRAASPGCRRADRAPAGCPRSGRRRRRVPSRPSSTPVDSVASESLSVSSELPDRRGDVLGDGQRLVDVDAACARQLQAGRRPVAEVAEQPPGDDGADDAGDGGDDRGDRDGPTDAPAVEARPSSAAERASAWSGGSGHAVRSLRCRSSTASEPYATTSAPRPIRSAERRRRRAA